MEAYLKKCLDSILAQTYKNLQIILVNDGSTDGCADICDAYAKQDSRFLVVHKENGGVVSARNAGLAVAQGSYVGWVDPDDYIEPNMFESLVGVLERENADVVFCEYFWHLPDDGSKHLMRLPHHRDCGVSVLDKGSLMYLFCERETTTSFMFWNKLYKRSIFEGNPIPEGYLAEDFAFYIPMLRRSERYAFCYMPLYNHVERASSLRYFDEEAWMKQKQVHLPALANYARENGFKFWTLLMGKSIPHTQTLN